VTIVVVVSFTIRFLSHEMEGSPSARLTTGGEAVLNGSDVRRAQLLDGQGVLGRQSTCHNPGTTRSTPIGLGGLLGLGNVPVRRLPAEQ
jgi:hypothetical protein